MEENEGVGGELEREEREEEDELVEGDERPERLHGRLAKGKETYRQSWVAVEPMKSERVLQSKATPTVSIVATRVGLTN